MPFKNSNSFSRGWSLLSQAQLQAVLFVTGCTTNNAPAGISGVDIKDDIDIRDGIDIRDSMGLKSSVNFKSGMDFKSSIDFEVNIGFGFNCL